MITRIILTIIIAFAASPAMADPPAGKGKGKGPNPPGHAYGLREKQDESYSKELEKLVTERDRALVKINNTRDASIKKVEKDRDRDLKKAGSDDERAAINARYEATRERILTDYDAARAQILADYSAKRERLLGESDEDDDRDDDDDDDGDDDDDDDDRDHLDRRPVDRRTGKDVDRSPGADADSPDRRSRDVRADIAEIDEDMSDENAAHEKRMQSLHTARKRAAAAGNEQQVATLDQLAKRERERHVSRIASLAARRADLEAELERRRSAETDDASDDGKAGSPEPGRRAPANRDDASGAPKRDRGKPDASTGDGGKKLTDRERMQQRVKEFQSKIKEEEAEYAKRKAELEGEIKLAAVNRDDIARGELKQEYEQLEAQHERRMARMNERLAAAKAGREDPDEPKAPRSDVRKLRRAFAEAEEDIDAEKRRHQRRNSSLYARLAGSDENVKAVVRGELTLEQNRHEAAMVPLERKRDRLREELANARERKAAKAVAAPKLDSPEEIEAMIKELQNQLDASKAKR